MTETVIGGSSGSAVKFPHDEGLPNISDGSETWDSAGYLMALGQAVDGGSYARSDQELIFSGHDGANDQVDVTAGIAFLDLSGETVNVQSSLGGTSPPAYDISLPTLPAIMVIVPTTITNLDVTDSTLNDFWLAYATDETVGGVSAGDIYIRHGSGLSAPPHPNVKLGEANPDSAGADVLENRGGNPTFSGLTVNGALTADGLTINDFLRAGEATETISSGVVPYSAPYLAVQPESGGSDDLDNISGASAGDIVIVHPANFDTITVTHGDGFRLAGTSNKTLDSPNDTIMLIARSSTLWDQIAYSDNQ